MAFNLLEQDRWVICQGRKLHVTNIVLMSVQLSNMVSVKRSSRTNLVIKVSDCGGGRMDVRFNLSSLLVEVQNIPLQLLRFRINPRLGL